MKETCEEQEDVTNGVSVKGREFVSMGNVQIQMIPGESMFEKAQWKAHKCLRSNITQFGVAFVILCNCVTVGIELQTGKPLGLGGTIFEVFENLFLCVYVCELSTRFFAYGAACLNDNWVKFDVIVVGSGVLEQWILIPTNTDVSGLGILVILRVLRLFRLARTFKLLVQFREMAILIKGLMSSAGIVVYTLVLLIVMLFIFACAGKELVGSVAQDPDVDPVISDLAVQYFSTVTVSMLTLVQFVCLDSVAAIYEPMIKARPILSVYFLCTILVIGIVLMNLITAVMVNSAIEKAQEDKDVMRAIAREKSEKLAHDIRDLFVRLDEDGSHDISKEEFMNLDDEHMMLLNECLPEMDPLEIFEAVDVDNSGSVDIEEFAHGVMNLVKSGVSPQMKRMCKQMDIVHNTMRQIIVNQELIFKHLGMPVPAHDDHGTHKNASVRAKPAPVQTPAHELAQKAEHDWDQMKRTMDGMLAELRASLSAESVEQLAVIDLEQPNPRRPSDSKADRGGSPSPAPECVAENSGRRQKAAGGTSPGQGLPGSVPGAFDAVLP